MQSDEEILSANVTAQPATQVTRLLLRWADGDGSVLEELTPLIYDDLLRLAKSRLRKEYEQSTLDPTALVHEAYMRLERENLLPVTNRAHFYAFVATTMKRVLVDAARRRESRKRDGGVRVTLHPDLVSNKSAGDLDLLVLDDALRRLALVDVRKSRIIELKYFGGLTTEEIGQLENISVATVGREVRLGQAWLRNELQPESTPTP